MPEFIFKRIYFMKKMQNFDVFGAILWGGALTLALETSVHAQPLAPDAGQTLRELQRQAPPTPPTGAATLSVPADTASAGDSSVHFPVREVRVQGNQQLSSDLVAPLVAPLNGRETSLSELRHAAAQITALYRSKGFVVSRAFVPAQQITDGVVYITVLEGRLSAANIQNQTKNKTSVLQRIVGAQALEGKVIRSAELDRELLLIADLPAVGNVSGALKPGQEIGTSDLVITAAPGKSYNGSVALDNYGNRYTGQNRLGGNIDLNSPFNIGDRLSIRGTLTDEDLQYGRIAYDLPVNGDGLRLGAAYSSSQYDLGQEFKNLDATGTAKTSGLNATYPLVRGLNTNVWLRGAYEARELRDEVRSTDVSTSKSIKAALFDAYGDLADSVGGGAYSTWRASATFGDLAINNAEALAFDQAAPKANGNYRKLELAATRLQALAPHTSLYGSANLQWAGKNLDSSEKFSLGGANGVRAYPQGEAVGDSGWLANIEVRQELTAGIQGALFYDYGRVTYNKEPFAPDDNDRSLKGYGASLKLSYRDISAKSTIAWRDGEAATSAPDRNPRFWLEVSTLF